ncbi:MAG: SGNH/GDSL hydrolase family protein [Acidobacteriota bacterium]
MTRQRRDSERRTSTPTVRGTKAIDLVPANELPRVLLIGDSIAANYTPFVRELLDGKANIIRIPINGGPTTNGLRFIDQWLGNDKSDVIHFNWELHDVKWCDDNGTLTEVGVGHQQVPITAYDTNLRHLVARLKKTGATLIWCSTTPVPAKSKGASRAMK